MMSFLNFIRWEMNLFLAAVILILLLPFSSYHKVRYYGCYAVYVMISCSFTLLLMPFYIHRIRDVRNIVFGGEITKHVVSKLIGIQWELRGLPILKVERGAVIVSNHQSILDLLAMLQVWKAMDKCAVVARKELFYFWPIGLAAWMTGVVFIDRNRSNVAKNQLNETFNLITKEKTKLWIFPEGTRNKNPETLMPFKKGAFRVAVTCQVPIIPVVISPYYFIDSEKKYFGRGRVIMNCLEPVSTEGKTELDIDSIMEEVRGKMVNQYDLLRKEVLEQKEEIQ